MNDRLDVAVQFFSGVFNSMKFGLSLMCMTRSPSKSLLHIHVSCKCLLYLFWLARHVGHASFNEEQGSLKEGSAFHSNAYLKRYHFLIPCFSIQCSYAYIYITFQPKPHWNISCPGIHSKIELHMWYFSLVLENTDEWRIIMEAHLSLRDISKFWILFYTLTVGQLKGTVFSSMKTITIFGVSTLKKKALMKY